MAQQEPVTAQAPRAEICSGLCRLDASYRLVAFSRSVRSPRYRLPAFVSKKVAIACESQIVKKPADTNGALLPADIYVLTVNSGIALNAKRLRGIDSISERK